MLIIGAALFAALVTSRWFHWGEFIASGDIPVFVRDGLYPEFTSVWNHFTTGAGTSLTGIGQAIEVVLLKSTGALGIPPWFAQWMLYAICVGSAAVGAAYFAHSLEIKARYCLLASLVAVANPLMLTLLPNLLPYLTLGVVGGLGGMIVRESAADPASWRSRTSWLRPVAFAFVSLGASYVSLNLPLIAAILIGAAGAVGLATLLNGRSGFIRVVKFLAKASPLAVLLNLWWIVPTAQSLLTTGAGTTLTAVTDINSWKFTQQRLSLANVSTLTGEWGWPYPQYYPWSKTLDSGLFAVIRYALPVAAFAAPFVVLRRRRAAATWLACSALILIFVCKGLHEPLGAVNTWLYQHAPLFWLFRDPLSKFGPILVLVYGALFAMTIEGLLARRNAPDARFKRGAQQRRHLLLAIGATLCVAAFSYPIFSGGVMPDNRPQLPSAHVELPSKWQDAADYVNSAQPGKVLVLPFDDFYAMPTTWGFYGADTLPRHLFTRPVIMRVPASYYGEEPGYDALLTGIDDSLRSGDSASARRILQQLGASQVVLRTDFDRTMFPDRTIASPLIYERTLRSIAGAPQSFEVADVYRISDDTQTMISVDSSDAVVNWKQASPSHFSVAIDNAPSKFTLILRDSYASGWSLSGLPDGAAARHVEVDGYANGWEVTGASAHTRLTVEYQPAKWGHRAIMISLIAGAACLGFVLIGKLRHLTTRRSAQ